MLCPVILLFHALLHPFETLLRWTRLHYSTSCFTFNACASIPPNLRSVALCDVVEPSPSSSMLGVSTPMPYQQSHSRFFAVLSAVAGKSQSLPPWRLQPGELIPLTQKSSPSGELMSLDVLASIHHMAKLSMSAALVLAPMTLKLYGVGQD